ncbi:MAG: hypothetical protein Q8919_01365 [Bacteroidota bacterium]|nr:hypothetical protein [Bacteroidota bacterium]
MRLNTKHFAPVLSIAVLLLIAITTSSCSNSTSTGTATPGYNDSDIVEHVFKHTATVYGKTYTQWSTQWWQWVMSVPATTATGAINNPMVDTNGAQASIGQQGSVFFLGGKFTNATVSSVTRSVTIPATEPIFFPIAALLQDQIITGNTNTTTMQANLVAFIGSLGGIAVSLDNVLIFPTNKSGSTHNPSGQFSYTLPDKNIYQYLGLTANAQTVSPAFADGYYVMLGPLTAGSHVLKFSYNFASSQRSQQVTYNITSK